MRGRFGGRFWIQFSHIRLRCLLNILVELANWQLNVWVYSFEENPGVGIIRVLVVFKSMRKDKSIKEISKRKRAKVWSLGHTHRLQRSGRRGMKETKGGITEVEGKPRTWCFRKWKWKSLSPVRLFDPIDSGILQARILEWVTFPFSRGSSWPRNRTRISCIAGRFFTSRAMREHLPVFQKAEGKNVSRRKQWSTGSNAATRLSKERTKNWLSLGGRGS